AVRTAAARSTRRSASAWRAASFVPVSAVARTRLAALARAPRSAIGEVDIGPSVGCEAVAADVRLAGPDDLKAMAWSLARAFRDDPIFTWLVPDVEDEERARRSTGFFTVESRIRIKE